MKIIFISKDQVLAEAFKYYMEAEDQARVSLASPSNMDLF